MRKALLNLHLCLAVIVGVFVVIIGVTGSIMAFEEDIDKLLQAITGYTMWWRRIRVKQSQSRPQAVESLA